MTRQQIPGAATIADSLRHLLLRLAREQDNLAALEAAATPYWAHCPSSVIGHRAAAEVLRAEAEQLLVAS